VVSVTTTRVLYVCPRDIPHLLRRTKMTCDKECNQGRCCDCSRYTDRAAVIIIVVFVLGVLGMLYGMYKLLSGVM
jgi:hypothetical protein